MNRPPERQKIYLEILSFVAVLTALFFLTITTVAISTLHLDKPLAVCLALFIAVVKGGLVASFFMHLLMDKNKLWGLLVLTAILFLAVLLLPLFGQLDAIRDMSPHLY